MNQLLKLQNGAWVKPCEITAIRPLMTTTGELGHLHRARVVVHHGNGFTEILLANDDEHAQTIADELAGLFNAASRESSATAPSAPSQAPDDSPQG